MKKNQSLQNFEDLIFMNCGDGLINYELKMHFETIEKQNIHRERESSFQSSSEQDELFVRTRQRMRIESFEEAGDDSKLTLDTLDFSAVTKKFKIARTFESDAEEDSVSKLLKIKDIEQEVGEKEEFENTKDDNLETQILDIPDTCAQSLKNQLVVKINFSQRNKKIKKQSKRVSKKPVNVAKVKIKNKVNKVRLFWNKESKQIPSVFYLTQKLGNKQYKEWQCYAKKEVLISQDHSQLKKIEFSNLQKICSKNCQVQPDTDFSFEKNFD